MTITYPFPFNAVCLVKEGNKINFDTPLFEKKINQNISLNISRELEINPKNIFRNLKKLVGEKVKKGDIIASKKGLFTSKKVRCPDDGIIKEIDHHQGILIIETADKKKSQVLSPFKGEVEKVNKDSLVVNLSKAQEFSLKKASQDFGGEVFYFTPSSELSTNDVLKKIIFCEHISSYLQVKSEALGALGYVTSQELPENTKSFTSLVKNEEDIKKIHKLKHPYCTIISKSAKIYFYQ